MTKQPINVNSSILNIISTFNFISKCMGFSVTKYDDTVSGKFIREIIFLWLLIFAMVCTVFSELWCIKFLDMTFRVKKIVVFVINQMVILSPLSCLLYFRLCDLSISKIILKVERVEEILKIFEICLETGRIRFVGLCFWLFQFFTVMSTILYLLWPNMVFFIVDTLCVFYFEAWVTVPYLQFVAWISLLCYVLYRVRLEIIEINKLQYSTIFHVCEVNNRSLGCGFVRVSQIKRAIEVVKHVLNITKELSSAYGITLFLYIMNYLSRILVHLYDLLDKDAQKFPLWMCTWNAVVRFTFILPVFICCEQLSHNINKTVELIQEIVILHQPSCLDCIFQSLTLRLQHQSTTTQICGFLNLTYGSFLTIMTTALAFLLLQLQFSK